jgi:hypothetical protein
MHDGLARTCRFLIDAVRRAAPFHWKQGTRRPALVAGSAAPEVRLVVEQRLKGVCEEAARGIAAWSRGLGVTVFERVPEPGEVLALQARGERCVSLLPDGMSPAPHASALEFLLHDLCHLGKFADPRYHAEQVGFFASFALAIERPEWLALEQELDAEWVEARDHVLCDMNGSSIFLFAAFKMKLKMAARRSAARATGREPRQSGPLDRDEERAFHALLERALPLIGLGDPELRAAAIETSARRDCPAAASVLGQHFRARGAERLQNEPRSP